METVREIEKREIRKYHYPTWVDSVVKIEWINDNPISQVYASILHETVGNKHISFLDMRLWKDGRPTAAGVYVDRSAALVLRDILDRFILGDLDTDKG